LNGCASLGASNREALLSAAGFREKTPQTARQRHLYAATQPYHVQRITARGRTFYVYKDESRGTAWVGGEKEYQEYQRLAIKQRIARENYEAAEMNQEMAWDWYGAYGPYFWGPNFGMFP
jgi:hypothetical protein